MEANSKLQRKKRIAHSHMSKSNLDGPKLPLDDFVYKIINDMDSNNIMSSYELSQDSKSNRRHETSKSNGQYKNSNPDSYCKKLEKKFLPKKSFPLMQKSQTSLKYLNKNRCIPKPRAHVGSIPKPPKQPAALPGPSIPNSMTENVKNSVRRTEVQSNAYRQLIESNLIRDSNIKTQQNKTTEKKDMITQDNDRITQDNDSSNSDDDDAAYENFLKRTKEESKISTDSDSDSHLTIRKKRKSTQRRKKLKRQSTKCISKVTSIPLSDSSDSQSEEALEANERLEHRKESTKNCTQVPAKTVEFQSDSSLDELPDINTNYSSSEEDTSIGSAAKENTEPHVDFIDKFIPAIENSTDKVSSFKLSSKATLQQGDENLASIFDSTSQFPCCVRLKRDPIIEQKAKAYISSLNYSTIDCINISDESDTESSTLLSNDSPSFLSDSRNGEKSVQSFDSSNFQEIDDCIIVCELPKVGASTPHEQPPASRGITSTSTETNCEQSSISDEPADVTSVSGESNSRTIEEFKVQIVAVQSVIEKSENSTIDKTEENVEIIDISDDEVVSQQNDGASKNVEVVRQLDAEPNTTVRIQHNINDNHFIPNDQNQGSQMLLSNPISQSDCQELPVQVHKISNSKILDVLNKIDFNSIQEILSKSNSNQSEASTVGETLMSNEKQHTSIGPLPDSTNKNFSQPNAAIQGINCSITSACVVSSDPAIDLRSSSNAVKHIPVVSAGETNKLNEELSNKICAGENNVPATLNFESSPIDIPVTQKQIVAVGDNFHCSNIKTLIQKQIKDSEIEDIGEYKSFSCTTNVKKRKDAALCSPVIKRPKYEMFENSSDELDVIAASFTEDLGTPNKKVEALLDLYKGEFAKYKNIKYTEANVTQGLRLLRDKQKEKLIHLRSSIESVAKHDPCFFTAVQEKFQSKAQASIKSEEKLRPQSSIPPSSSVNNDIPVHAQANIEVIDRKPSGSEPSVCHPKLEGKLTKSEHQQEPGTLAQSEVKVKHSVVTTDRERLLEYLRSLKCGECGKPAAVSCQGCAQAFYCSPQCAAISWKKRHKVTCRRRIQVEKAM